MAKAYYNEIDKFDAAWLRNLVSAGEIAPGDVDERSIEDVTPNDLSGYTQCHFFAGIGGWSLAARRAGWPDDRPLWTGSCPCQPFSAAGKGAGFADERHLWPAWHWLIQQCRPGEIRGEQVAQGGGLEWFDLVATDLEREGYAVAAADIPAAGFGGWHIRQRLYLMAHAGSQGLQIGQVADDRRGALRHQGQTTAEDGLPDSVAHPSSSGQSWPGRSSTPQDGGVTERSLLSSMADATSEQQHGAGHRGPSGRDEHSDSRSIEWLGHSERDVSGRRPGETPSTEGQGGGFQEPSSDRPVYASQDVVWLPCRDGKYRPTQPGLFPLAHGVSGRVGRLRAYGNAIHIPTAEAWLRATA